MTPQEALAQALASAESGESWDERVKTLAHPSLYPGTDPLDVYVELVDSPRRLAAAILDALPEEEGERWVLAKTHDGIDCIGCARRIGYHAGRERAAQQERERLREKVQRSVKRSQSNRWTTGEVLALLADPEEDR